MSDNEAERDGNPETFVSDHSNVSGESGSCLHARGQDFHIIRQKCLEEPTLFEDPKFPADKSSIALTQDIKWKRPHEITDDPKFFINGASRFDVDQGGLDNCWFVAALANLAMNKHLFDQVVPSNQDFGDNYAGIFHFKFWQCGEWIDVVVDDRLPTIDGQLLFIGSDENEFWPALVEKAFAKLHGSYGALEGGVFSEAMEYFTGGVSEYIELTKAPQNLFKIMLQAYTRGSLMGCSTEKGKSPADNGLVRNHAYSVTGVKSFEINTIRDSGKIPLVRIRNPHGNETEWNGPWSDESEEWKSISEDEKKEIGLTIEHDGEFWMSFEDFLKNFVKLRMTHLNPGFLENKDIDSSSHCKWEMSVFKAAWKKDSTAGGSSDDTFWQNPQYRITLTDVNDDDDDDKCTIIVALMQENKRKMDLENHFIGFHIYHLPDPDDVPSPLDYSFFESTRPSASAKYFENRHQVSHRFELHPGTYCIVPSTYDSNKEGKFILRVFSEKPNKME